jgi:hypothetical protein
VATRLGIAAFLDEGAFFGGAGFLTAAFFDVLLTRADFFAAGRLAPSFFRAAVDLVVAISIST